MNPDKRIDFLDFARGIAIIMMLFFHNMTYFEGSLNDFANSVGNSPIASIFKFFGRWAGFFAFISGIVNGYIYIIRISQGKNTPQQMLKGIIVFAFFLFLFDKIARIFFARAQIGGGPYDFEEGPTHYSLLTGYLETGQFQSLIWYSVWCFSGPLSMTGLSILFLGLLMYKLFQKNINEDLSKKMIILGIFGTFINFISGPLISFLRPLWVNAIENNQVITAILLGIFVGDTHPFLPFVGYAIYGAIFGIALAKKIPTKKVVKYGGIGAIFYCFIGIIAISILGESPLKHILYTPPFQMIMLQIGLMLLVCTLLYIIQTNEKETFWKKLIQNKTIHRFGVASLSVFLLEPVLGIAMKKYLLDILFPGWAQSMISVVIYDLFIIYLWSYLLRIWESYDYKGSCQWIISKFTFSLRGSSNNKEIEKIIETS